MPISTDDVLAALEANDSILSADTFQSEPFDTLKAALDRLKSREMVTYNAIDREVASLTPEAESIVEHGSHEARVFEAVRASLNGLSLKELPGIVGQEAAKVGQGNAFKQKWIAKSKDKSRDKKDVLVATADSIQDTTKDLLLIIKDKKTHSDPRVLADLRKRKLLTTQKVITFKISKGPKYAREFVKEETDLTADMIASGAWKSVELKPYNFNAKGAPSPAGALHPLNKVRQEFRLIFFGMLLILLRAFRDNAIANSMLIEMGFTEMPTNKFVESGFWNFDALFVPGQHPARDMQDTFFISDPPYADPPREDPPNSMPSTASLPGPSHKRTKSKSKPAESDQSYKTYWDNVRTVHESGKYGSIGYRYPWSADEALRLVLRTHTTAVSTYMLHKLAADPKPARYFSIDRVFRNESLDQTHLAEFHQVEGVIADYNLALGGLIGFMKVFFSKMGINQLRFKPAYNPYTEPSMEIFGWHEGLNKWMEIGNSGMFRPEMLESMGLPKDMRVYGWGLSLERPTMIK